MNPWQQTGQSFHHLSRNTGTLSQHGCAATSPHCLAHQAFALCFLFSPPMPGVLSQRLQAPETCDHQGTNAAPLSRSRTCFSATCQHSLASLTYLLSLQPTMAGTANTDRELLGTRYYSKHFACINSSNSQAPREFAGGRKILWPRFPHGF